MNVQVKNETNKLMCVLITKKEEDPIEAFDQKLRTKEKVKVKC